MRKAETDVHVRRGLLLLLGAVGRLQRRAQRQEPAEGLAHDKELPAAVRLCTCIWFVFGNGLEWVGMSQAHTRGL